MPLPSVGPPSIFTNKPSSAVKDHLWSRSLSVVLPVVNTTDISAGVGLGQMVVGDGAAVGGGTAVAVGVGIALAVGTRVASGTDVAVGTGVGSGSAVAVGSRSVLEQASTNPTTTIGRIIGNLNRALNR